jgi:hypothetical protein
VRSSPTEPHVIPEPAIDTHITHSPNDQLLEDIRKHGLREPISLIEQKIIDGVIVSSPAKERTDDDDDDVTRRRRRRPRSVGGNNAR